MPELLVDGDNLLDLLILPLPRFKPLDLSDPYSELMELKTPFMEVTH
jgi:hypothetical protein